MVKVSCRPGHGRAWVGYRSILIKVGKVLMLSHNEGRVVADVGSKGGLNGCKGKHVFDPFLVLILHTA